MSHGETIAAIVGLIVAGLVLFLVEIITPTFGIVAGLGLASLAGSVWLGFTISQTLGLVMIVAFVFILPTYLALLVKLLPNSPLGRRLFLKQAPQGAGDAAPETPKLQTLVGREGVAESLLRPTGAVRVDGQRVIASAESGMIEKGSRVRVIRAEGFNVVVRKMENQ